MVVEPLGGRRDTLVLLTDRNEENEKRRLVEEADDECEPTLTCYPKLNCGIGERDFSIANLCLAKICCCFASDFPSLSGVSGYDDDVHLANESENVNCESKQSVKRNRSKCEDYFDDLPTTTAATTTAAAIITPTTASVAASFTAATALRRRRTSISGHLNSELASIQSASVHFLKRVLSITAKRGQNHSHELNHLNWKANFTQLPLIVEPNEGEASALACVTIPRDINIADFTASLENASQVLGCRSISQIVNLKALESITNLPRTSFHAGMLPNEEFFLRRGKQASFGRRKMCYFTFSETIPSILGGGRAILYCGICFCRFRVELRSLN